MHRHFLVAAVKLVVIRRTNAHGTLTSEQLFVTGLVLHFVLKTPRYCSLMSRLPCPTK
jgi:hypothetical protein